MPSWQKIYTKGPPSEAEVVHLGQLKISIGDTTNAIAAFEKTPGHDLEAPRSLRRRGGFADARAALDLKHARRSRTS